MWFHDLHYQKIYKEILNPPLPIVFSPSSWFLFSKWRSENDWLKKDLSMWKYFGMKILHGGNYGKERYRRAKVWGETFGDEHSCSNFLVRKIHDTDNCCWWKIATQKKFRLWVFLNNHFIAIIIFIIFSYLIRKYDTIWKHQRVYW